MHLFSHTTVEDNEGSVLCFHFRLNLMNKLTVHQEYVVEAWMFPSLVGGNAHIYTVIVYGDPSEVQRVVFYVISHCFICDGSVRAELHVVLHPGDVVIGPTDFTGQGEVCRAYWNCVVSDHH